MTDFSLPIINVLLGGGQDELLENCHKNCLGGDGSAMMTALIFCSLQQKEIPDLVADELLTLDDKLAAGKLSGVDEFFNYKPTHKAKLGMNKRINQSESKVCGALFNHRINGGELFLCRRFG
jgi:hypothetical protein